MGQTHQLLSFNDWAKAAGAGISGDPLWSVQSYRIALYAVECLTFDRRSNSVFAAAPAVDQLTRALGSIAAHIAEGYSRGSVADRRQFCGYALGSTREAIAWYNGETRIPRQSLPASRIPTPHPALSPFPLLASLPRIPHQAPSRFSHSHPASRIKKRPLPSPAPTPP